MRLSPLSLLYVAVPAFGLITTPLSNGFNNYSWATGVTRHFFLNISSGIVAPDGSYHVKSPAGGFWLNVPRDQTGFPRQGVTVNETTPGPTLHVDEGDEVEACVSHLNIREDPP